MKNHGSIVRSFRTCSLLYNKQPPTTLENTAATQPSSVNSNGVVPPVVNIVFTTTNAEAVKLKAVEPSAPVHTNESSGTATSDVTATPTANTTIIKIDSAVLSEEIEKAVKHQIKQKLQNAYEPTGEESFEVLEHLERERLYAEGKKVGFFTYLKRFYKRKSSLLSNLLLIGKVLPANALATLFFSFYKMEKNYKERVFEQRITASLNFIDDASKVFKVRNIFCKNLDEVFLNNQAAVQVVQEAAAKTSSESPIVVLPNEDKWFILNLIQSCISQNVCSSGYFRQDMNLPHHSEWYVFSITNETDISVRKMRVVIVQEKLLQKINNNEIQEPQFGKY